MFKRLRIFAPILLVVAALVAPAPTFAAYTGNLAGRPMDGNSAGGKGGNDCHGIAYGRVDGTLVLFSAYHCMTDHTLMPYWPDVHGPDGSVIGTWYTGTTGRTNDIAFVNLIAGAHPSVLNKVYSNNGSGGYTITAQPFISCPNAPGSLLQAYQAFQTTNTSTYGPNIGSGNGHVTTSQNGVSGCRMKTTIPTHNNQGYKDSGTPMLFEGSLNTVSGVGSQYDLTYDWFGSVADGLAELVAGPFSTATLCTTAAC